MSENDIRRIADAIEKIAQASKPNNSNEIIAGIHENYAERIKTIFENSQDTFDTMRMFRSLELLARQTVIQLRDK